MHNIHSIYNINSELTNNNDPMIYISNDRCSTNTDLLPGSHNNGLVWPSTPVFGGKCDLENLVGSFYKLLTVYENSFSNNYFVTIFSFVLVNRLSLHLNQFFVFLKLHIISKFHLNKKASKLEKKANGIITLIIIKIQTYFLEFLKIFHII